MKIEPRKNYGSIGHLPESRLGAGDHYMQKGQASILTEKARDVKDLIIVQEKLDGANVGVIRTPEGLVGITRKGHRAIDSPMRQFQMFQHWINSNEDRFDFLDYDERVVGEWVAMAHGTKYMLTHAPFIAFDIMKEDVRETYINFRSRISNSLPVAHLLHIGQPISVKKIDRILGHFGHHGAREMAEGAVWRVEREGKVDFLAKYVRHGKEDGKYFSQNHDELIWNWEN